MNVCGLLEVEPFVEFPISELYPEGSNITLRSCDLCGNSLIGKRDRVFYFDPDNALSVCEDCVGEYLTEKP